MSECSICFQDYGNDCTPATLPCGHLNCFDCLSLLAEHSPSRPACPACREPYTSRNIVKLFITFPNATALASDSDGGENPATGDQLPTPLPPLTEEQKAEAGELSSKMSALGIEGNVDELAAVLSDVKLWATGVGTISDLETQVAMTRLLLGVDILKNKTEKTLTVTTGARKAEEALGASRRVEAALRDKLNRENASAARLRTAYTEQVALVQKWKDIANTTKTRVQVMEDQEIDHLTKIATLSEKTTQQASEIAELTEELEKHEDESEKWQDKFHAQLADKRRYDKRIAGLEKELDTREQLLRHLKGELRTQKQAAEDFEDQTRGDIVGLKAKVRSLEAAYAECQRELESQTAAFNENATQLLRLKQDREHWREEYFKLKENGPPSVIAPLMSSMKTAELIHPSTSNLGRSQSRLSQLHEEDDEETDLIDLNKTPSPDSRNDTPAQATGSLGPVRTHRSSLARSLSSTPIPDSTVRQAQRGSKRSRTDAEFESLSSSPRTSSPYPKRRGALESASNASEYGSLRRSHVLRFENRDRDEVAHDDEDVVEETPRRKVRRRVSPTSVLPEPRRKFSGGFDALHELLASADDED